MTECIGNIVTIVRTPISGRIEVAIAEKISVPCEFYIADVVEPNGQSAFDGCTGLRRITLPAGLRSPHEAALPDRRNLTVYHPDPGSIPSGVHIGKSVRIINA